MELIKYMHTLFDSGEGVCTAKHPRGTVVSPMESSLERLTSNAFISINPLDLKQDRRPTESWHNELMPRRADHNVTKFRNILVEMDKMPVEQQQIFMVEIGLPYSALVFSGNKSYHWVISLEVPLETRKEYDRLVTRVYKAVGNDLVDQTCRNPSRFTRVPGHLREDTKREQFLVHVAGRINIKVLEAWLIKRGAPKVEEVAWEDITYNKRKRDISSLYPATRNFLMNGTQENWNHTLFKAAADICRNGWDIEEAHEMLSKITGHLDMVDEKTIKSAYINEENKDG